MTKGQVREVREVAFLAGFEQGHLFAEGGYPSTKDARAFLERYMRSLYPVCMDGSPTCRADGWPICPKCGEDELFSKSADMFKCLFCSWQGRIEKEGVE